MKSYYCSAVDTGLFVYVDGSVKVCCSGNEIFGSVRQTPVNEIFLSEKFTQLQSDLKNNKPNSYCQGCYKMEDTAPGSSQWSAFNDQFPSNFNQRKLKLIDIRWSNVCNLTCRYCNIHDSSEWRKLKSLPIESVNRDYTESLFELVENNLDTIECVYLLGGEPLLQKHNVRLLDMLPKHVKIDILTNGSVDLTYNKVYEKLKLFPNTYWNLSFDNVNERFEYVRAGAGWNLLTENIEILKQDFSTNNVTFHPVYHIWNATRLLEFYDFADSKGNLRVNWQLGLPSVDPNNDPTDSFVVFGHNKHIIELALAEIDKLSFDDYFLTGVKQSLLDDQEDTTKGQRFIEWTARMEQTVPPKYTFAELWPELNIVLSK
jgi:sulfatase maturation enzyme AslB (radical SAM superfamily)